MPDPSPRKIETGTDELLAEVDAHVALITLNRPHARNALSDTLSPALRDLLPTLADDPDMQPSKRHASAAVSRKFSPVTVSAVPPLTGPLLGERPVTRGAATR